MDYFETFGEALSRLMRSRGCSMKELAERMKIKSANTIARIATNKSSINKIQSFCNAFLEINPLQLVETEKKELEEALVVSRMGVDAYAASRQMLNFVRKRTHVTDCVCKQAFGEDSLFVVTLDDLLLSYQDYARVDIMLQNCALNGVIRVIKTFLEGERGVEVNVEHYVSSSEDHVKMIGDFTSLLDVMGHPNYHFFLSPTCGRADYKDFNAYDHVMVVLKCDKNGDKWTDTVRFYGEDGFDLLYNTAGEAAYEFNLRQFQSLRVRHNPANEIYSPDFSFHGMKDYNRRLLEMDQKHSSVMICPNISLCMVPPDISQAVTNSALKEPIGKSDPYFQEYLQVVSRRYQLFCNPKKRQTYVFSKAGMLYFFKHGKSKANIFGLRDLTEEERRRVIEGILQVARTVPTTRVQLLKNDLQYNNISYLLYEEEMLLIDSYPEFSNFDPSRRYHSCVVRAPEITKNFAHFVAHDLLEHYVHSTEETIAFLEELLQS